MAESPSGEGGRAIRRATLGHHAQAQLGVVHRARQDADLADDGALADGRGIATGIVGMRPAVGFMPDDAAEGRGDADAAADVGSEAQWRAARRDDGRLAAAAAAG